jgi:hypothetical protein
MNGDFFQRVWAQAGEIARSRSSALVPLHWITAILVAFLLLSVALHAPGWMQIGLFVLLALVILQSVVSYNYFMTTNPDALRSEKHVLSKYAIDKGLYGDSDSGLIEIQKFGNEFVLDAASSGRASQLSKPSEEREA